MMQHTVRWVDAGREPQCQPNPNYPKGIDMDCSEGAQATCTIRLPYPARRCGYYHIMCETCGLSVACTTAGRPDDPRSIKLACQLVKPGH
jgi:hypothetical protein